MSGKKRRAPVWLMAAADIVLAGLILLAFAYFHHGRAYLSREMLANMSTAQALPSVAPTGETGETDFGFPDGTFADGEAVQTENTYKSANVSVSWERIEDEIDGKTAVYYLADIYVRSPDYFRAVLASDGYAQVSKLAEENNAIIAINGDYATAREQGVIVRGGQLVRDTAYEDVLVMYSDGSMAAFSAEEFDLSAEEEKGVLNVWSFGPSLLDSEGKSIDSFESTVASPHPRSAVGYYEPGHYCFLASEGRGMEGADGLSLTELSALFERLGCSIAYNLDGGKSSVMAWDLGQSVINKPVDGGRPAGDILYVPKE